MKSIYTHDDLDLFLGSRLYRSHQVSSERGLLLAPPSFFICRTIFTNFGKLPVYVLLGTVLGVLILMEIHYFLCISSTAVLVVLSIIITHLPVHREHTLETAVVFKRWISFSWWCGMISLATEWTGQENNMLIINKKWLRETMAQCVCRQDFYSEKNLSIDTITFWPHTHPF